MKINKIIITNGIYNDKELRLLVSFDENDNVLDLINLDNTMMGSYHLATVEKVLNDIDACIVKLDCDEKAFIENKKLIPSEFVVRHSEKKLVCQSDSFYVQIIQDKKSTKPYSCNFVKAEESKDSSQGFLNYYVEKYADSDVLIISDLPEIAELDYNIRYYSDEDISLWQLYGLTKIIDDATKRTIYLKSGANIVIEPTEAMTIVDVNSSKNYGKSNAFETNIEALKALAYHFRLRAISGIIIIDLLKCSKEERQEIIALTKDLFSNDISSISIHGFTNLGLLEVTRSRNFSPFRI